LEEGLLRIATYWWGGKRHVGALSADGRDVQPLALGPRGNDDEEMGGGLPARLGRGILPGRVGL